ncbi:MAG: hypothetical protein IPG61_08085 [bacterium]|nr:hypothetical protein [bacterium]
MIALLIVGAGLSSGCSKHDEQAKSADPVDSGHWSVSSKEYDCTTDELTSEDTFTDLVCPSDWIPAVGEECALVRSGNSYVIDCEFQLGDETCHMNFAVAGTLVVVNRKQYVVDGEMTITTSGAACADSGLEESVECTRIHEVGNWVDGNTDQCGDSGMQMKSAANADDSLRNEACRQIHTRIMKSLAAHVDWE